MARRIAEGLDVLALREGHLQAVDAPNGLGLDAIDELAQDHPRPERLLPRECRPGTAQYGSAPVELGLALSCAEPGFQLLI